MSLAVIDTHCHYVSAFAHDELSAALQTARAVGWRQALVCAETLDQLPELARQAQRFGLCFALGIHPFEAPRFARDPQAVLEVLDACTRSCAHAPGWCAIGEIGLDFSAAVLAEQAAQLSISTQEVRDWQTQFFCAQLQRARALHLPVSVHARSAIDTVTQCLRRYGVAGIIHAFNGSEQQALRLVQLNCKLGFGSTLTQPTSKKIRRVFSQLPAHAWVLETDAPWMPSAKRRAQRDTRTQPADIFAVLQAASELRHITIEHAARDQLANALSILPGLRNEHGQRFEA